MKECDVLFLDPDNGLEIESCMKLNQSKSGKFAYYSEVSKMIKGKEFIIIYHHLNRHKKHGTHTQQIKARMLALRIHVNPAGKIFALRYRPYSPRAYFILTKPSFESYVSERLATFLGSYWANLCDNYLED